MSAGRHQWVTFSTTSESTRCSRARWRSRTSRSTSTIFLNVRRPQRSCRVSHQLRAEESDAKLADLVARLDGVIEFDDQKVLYNWLGATRLDWRGQGQFRALTEEQEVWAVARGYGEVVVKTK